MCHRIIAARTPEGSRTRAFGPGSKMTKTLRRIDHIGIAVPDLEAAVAAFRVLFGAGPSSVEEVPDQKVRTAFFAAGDTDLELLTPTAADSPISGFLAKRGAGIHHVCFEVADLERALAEYERQGVRLIDATPRLGAHGKRIAFLHPRSTGGILLELCEVAPRTTALPPRSARP